MKNVLLFDESKNGDDRIFIVRLILTLLGIY